MADGDLIGAAQELIPPGMRPKNEMARWMMAVSIGVIGALVMSATHWALSLGFFGFMGLSGYASAEEMTKNTVQLTAIQQSLKQNDIDRDMRQVCMARAAGNQSALTAWTITLQRDEQAYAELSKTSAQVMDCATLLVTQSTGG